LSVEEVVQQALGIVHPAVERHFRPHEHFATQPLEWLKHMSTEWNLCDGRGTRAHHALWSMQVSWNNSKTATAPPELKTVGIDRIDTNFIYYWTNASFPSDPVAASIVSCMGNYPIECQWRSEGYLVRVTDEESSFGGYSAPPSLIAHMTACCKLSQGSDINAYSRESRHEQYDGLVQNSRLHPDPGSVCMIRFVPLRIELLRGGPSTRLPNFPKRYEWTRSTNAAQKNNNEWSMRAILPFSSVPKTTSLSMRGMTIAIVGTHSSGKHTVGSALAKLLGWAFDPELGDILRDSESLVAGGHMHGDGSSSTDDEKGNNWDVKVHDAECQRDKELDNTKSRVVETWHIGNAAWYSFREKQKQVRGVSDMNQYKLAIAKHLQKHPVIIIQLTLNSSSVIIERLRSYPTVRKRIPMGDECKECEDLYQCLQEDNISFIKEVVDSFGIPYLQIDNSGDGEEAMKETLTEVLAFVQGHLHRRIVS
jgi:hypothetical protein